MAGSDHYVATRFDTKRVRIVVVLLVAIAVVAYVLWVHERTGSWTLDPTESPLDSIVFEGRVFDDRISEPLPDGAISCGPRTDQGVPIEVFVSEFDSCSLQQVEIYVRAEGGTWSYGLVGGP